MATKRKTGVEMGPASKAPKTVSKEKNKGVEMSPAAKSLKTRSNKGKTRTTESKQQMKKGTKRTRAKALEEEKKAEEPPEAVKEEKKAQVKTGQPSKDELDDIASKLEDDSWKKLARRLRIEDPKITAIDKAHDDLFEKAYQMLLHWTHKEGTAATYQVLFEALDNDKVNYRDLAQKYCCVKID
ncbi:tumor necrosis factor receptor superfamily member 10B-like [Orbicella faveolata]|uniref:tumor necrosis factor receptor superfamily member 10B-like n=1 Tax=Orbicella faveolata TaxID=48498 RepID=UPI0009E5E926|nr:tumor necrosis factor receptor superfamily member 10B-like [Orbicella faveolata]XP_020614200.1 tumor necrosis factor receptor superfamily member 10B-like [Orbicella faveolata]